MARLPLLDDGTMNEFHRGDPCPHQDVLPPNWGGTELNHTVTCMVRKVTANDRHLEVQTVSGSGNFLPFLREDQDNNNEN
ncbi:hypothetical protein TNCV_1658841 [Trichonephila clavipes]|nr:hypothetical protein TNCV_1658841 [Trichonephila clavipes]